MARWTFPHCQRKPPSSVERPPLPGFRAMAMDGVQGGPLGPFRSFLIKIALKSIYIISIHQIRREVLVVVLAVILLVLKNIML